MKKPVGVRCILKWAGTIAGILILAGLLFSLGRYVTWVSADSRHGVDLASGSLVYGWRPAGWSIEAESYPPNPGVHVLEYGFPRTMRLGFRRESNRWWESITIPLWIPFAAVAAPSALLWYYDRRETARFLQRCVKRFRPSRRQRVTLACVAVFCAVHGVAVVGLWELFDAAHSFFARTNADYRLWPVVTDWIFLALFWSAPLWGVVWAKLFVRFRNWIRELQDGLCCDKCGYNLTGNVSGVCPECGTKCHKEITGTT